MRGNPNDFNFYPKPIYLWMGLHLSQWEAKTLTLPQNKTKKAKPNISHLPKPHWKQNQKQENKSKP